MKLKKISVALFSVLAANSTMGISSSFADEARQIEEVNVTATRRTTDVQDVPLAITALTGDSIENQNIENLEDLTGVVPNVLIAGGNAGTTYGSFYMRGIPNVGVYVDGIWQVANSGLLTREFVELDRVEVLRGPQGTLYGRDSTGGSIHIHSKKPAEEFGARVKVGVGNLDRRDITVSTDLPIMDNLRTKWTLGSYSQDGWVKSLVTGINGGYMDSDVFRADILYTPTDNLSFRLIHQEDDMVGRQARVQSLIDFRNADYLGYQVGIAQAHDIASGGMFNSSTAQAGAGLGKYQSRSGSRTPNRQFLEQTTFHADLAINDNMALKYMYGKTSNDSSIYNDWGGSEFNFFVNLYVQQTDLDSHEIQLTGSLFNDRVDYVVGAYSWDQTLRSREPEWSMADWMHTADMGKIKTLDYQDVLNSEQCTSRTPADAGYDFTGGFNVGLGQPITGNTSVDDWPFPCDWIPGGGWITALARPWPGDSSSDRLNEFTQEGEAYFGEITVYVTDAWDITLGYRTHSQDNSSNSMSVDHMAASIAAGITEARPIELDTEFVSRAAATAGKMDTFVPSSFSADTYRFATTYDISEDFMIYAGYSEGFNSGGVSLYADSVGSNQINYAPEIIENMEMGVRADLMDGSLRVNATYFQTDWLGIQYNGTVQDRETGQDVTELVLQNSADGEAKGVELEVTWLPTDGLTLMANLGFLDTAYTNINDGVELTTGTEFARAPEKTYQLSAEYEWTIGGVGDFVARWGANYWDEYWRTDTLALRQNAQGFVTNPPSGDIWMHNARVTYFPVSSDYEISLWVNNITDEYNLNSGFMHGIWQFDFATVDRPREYGLEFRANF